jgi:hypothetical protein
LIIITLNDNQLTSNIEFSCLLSVVNTIVNVDTVAANIWMISFVDSQGEDILFNFDLVLGRILQFYIVEEPS